MARRKPAIEVEITEGAIRVHHAGRTLTVVASPPPPAADGSPDFIIRLDDIEHWDTPHDEDEIDVEKLQLILTAIEDECDRHGLTVEFD
ncbi:MAG: Imm74 family immunity protein [Rhodoblastus sp.]